MLHEYNSTFANVRVCHFFSKECIAKKEFDMWVVGDAGFFSLVQKTNEERLTVRARVKKDLENLPRKYIPNLGEIEEGVGTDYPYRARVSREDFGEGLKRMALAINYGNFKASVRVLNRTETRANISQGLGGALRA